LREGEAIVASLAAPEPVGRLHPPRLIIGLLVATAFAAAAGAYELSLAGEYGRAPHVHAAIVAWITLMYVLCGLTAWWRRPESRFGPLMVAAGFAPFLSRLAEADVEVVRVLGEGLLLLPPVLFLHVFLAYPSGRLERIPERALVAVGYTAIFGVDLVRGLLEVAGQHGGADAALYAQRALILAVALGALAVLVSRRRSSGRPLRGSMELLVVSFALALGGLVVGLVMRTSDAPGTDVARWVAFGLVGVAPMVLLLGFLRDRLARTSLGELFVELRGDPSPADLQGALARALRDPSLSLLYWLPEFGTYADLEGHAVELPESADGRAVTLIDREGIRVAALIHDIGLLEETELLQAVTAAASIAVEHAQLHVELRARLEELRGSRARVIDAGQRERQRLERNLHDGAQQRLIALSLELSRLEQQEDDPALSLRLNGARREIASSLAELRAVAQGLHPAVLSGHGLEVALESIAARSAVPVELSIEVDGRLLERIEVAAYYVVSESLANVAKHAEATTAKVAVVQANGHLFVEILDDGIGGADTERGSGLRGLADRVEALNGRLRVWTPLGGGTRVRAEIPCA
jgi:signal transduction histidine kinase